LVHLPRARLRPYRPALPQPAGPPALPAPRHSPPGRQRVLCRPGGRASYRRPAPLLSSHSTPPLLLRQRLALRVPLPSSLLLLRLRRRRGASLAAPLPQISLAACSFKARLRPASASSAPVISSHCCVRDGKVRSTRVSRGVSRAGSSAR